jgi:ketosteroid isomerase-like protein
MRPTSWFCHSLNQLRGTTTDGEKGDVWFRQTLCFRKIRNDWRIAHQHESVPFYMGGSYRAAVDLKP